MGVKMMILLRGDNPLHIAIILCHSPSLCTYTLLSRWLRYGISAILHVGYGEDITEFLAVPSWRFALLVLHSL